MADFRVLVCGGRDFDDWAKLREVLGGVLERHPGLVVVTGGARGADRMAEEWAEEMSLERIVVEADWDTHGKAAGPIRNEKMLRDYTPQGVVAFPGGRGTAHMVSIAKKAGVPVIVVP